MHKLILCLTTILSLASLAIAQPILSGRPIQCDKTTQMNQAIPANLRNNPVVMNCIQCSCINGTIQCTYTDNECAKMPPTLDNQRNIYSNQPILRRAVVATTEATSPKASTTMATAISYPTTVQPTTTTDKPTTTKVATSKTTPDEDIYPDHVPAKQSSPKQESQSYSGKAPTSTPPADEESSGSSSTEESGSNDQSEDAAADDSQSEESYDEESESTTERDPNRPLYADEEPIPRDANGYPLDAPEGRGRPRIETDEDYPEPPTPKPRPTKEPERANQKVTSTAKPPPPTSEPEEKSTPTTTVRTVTKQVELVTTTEAPTPPKSKSNDIEEEADLIKLSKKHLDTLIENKVHSRLIEARMRQLTYRDEFPRAEATTEVSAYVTTSQVLILGALVALIIVTVTIIRYIAWSYTQIVKLKVQPTMETPARPRTGKPIPPPRCMKTMLDHGFDLS